MTACNHYNFEALILVSKEIPNINTKTKYIIKDIAHNSLLKDSVNASTFVLDYFLAISNINLLMNAK